MRTRLYFLLGLLPLAGCTSTTAPVDATGTLFEIEYVNYAWVPTWHGIVIDTAGTIHEFDLDGKTWAPAGEAWVTATQLENKWSHRSEERGTVPRAKLAEMAARVPAAEDGRLADPVNRCADAGTITYSAYRYDPARDAFHRVVMRREGDFLQLNDAAAARAIAEWLTSLNLIARIDGCSD